MLKKVYHTLPPWAFSFHPPTPSWRTSSFHIDVPLTRRKAAG